MSLLEKINQGIKDAIKGREQVRLDVLRMLKSKILAADARGNLSDEEITKLFKTYYGNIQESFEQAKSVNRSDIADRLKEELGIIQEFLPKTLSVEETRKVVAQAIEISGAKSKKDVGLVMKTIMKMGLPIDGKLAKELADQSFAE
ncbi:MAG: GatB/YqeY domain-containing protein [Verrucomicrobia bacterium]|nr:GatB/YqeY domain-containing protein [Verrucomicrobiota bacterium]